MRTPVHHLCVSCGRFAGAWAAACPYCGEAVRRTRAHRLGRVLCPGVALLTLAALAATRTAAAPDAWPALARATRDAAGTAPGAALLSLALGLAFLPPREGGRPGPCALLPRQLAGLSLANLLLALATGLLGALALGLQSSAERLLAGMALAALLFLPRLHGLNRAALLAGALAAATVAMARA